MREWLEAHKPAGSRRLHLLLAALMWSVVGSLLLFFGVRWIVLSRLPVAPLMAIGAIGAGVVKSRFVMDRAAGRIVERIQVRGDRRCIGGFLSVRTWGLVIVMAGCGRLLRTGLLPPLVIGCVYAAVGAALVLAARHLWRAWHGARA